MIGKKISHYKILEKIGEGGMREVYLVEKDDPTTKGKTLRELINTPLNPSRSCGAGSLIGGKPDPSFIPTSQFLIPSSGLLLLRVLAVKKPTIPYMAVSQYQHLTHPLLILNSHTSHEIDPAVQRQSH